MLNYASWLSQRDTTSYIGAYVVSAARVWFVDMHLHLKRALIECVRRVNMQKALSLLSRATQTDGTPDQGYVWKILQVLILSHIPYYRKYKQV